VLHSATFKHTCLCYSTRDPATYASFRAQKIPPDQFSAVDNLGAASTLQNKFFSSFNPPLLVTSCFIPLRRLSSRDLTYGKSHVISAACAKSSQPKPLRICPRPRDADMRSGISLCRVFGIRVAHTGRKTWFVTCRIEGRLRRHKIGTHPALSLHEARELARKFLGDVQKGKYNDAGGSTGTLGETVPEFIERYARPKNRRGKRRSAFSESSPLCLGSRSIKSSVPTSCAFWTTSLRAVHHSERTARLPLSRSYSRGPSIGA